MSIQTVIAFPAALVLGAGIAAGAMINYKANVSLAAFASQNDPAAVSAQDRAVACDTNESTIFRGQRPLQY
jgi:hypothetical protein